jgi:hypothetical protein
LLIENEKKSFLPCHQGKEKEKRVQKNLFILQRRDKERIILLYISRKVVGFIKLPKKKLFPRLAKGRSNFLKILPLQRRKWSHFVNGRDSLFHLGFLFDLRRNNWRNVWNCHLVSPIDILHHQKGNHHFHFLLLYKIK